MSSNVAPHPAAVRLSDASQAQRLEAVGRFACGVAHDINNMLVVINGYSDLVARRIADGPIRAEVREIRRAGERAATLTRQLLAFCRNEQPCPRLVSVSHVVRGVETMLPALIGHEIALTAALAPEVGLVLADPGQPEQIVVNLAVNARDAMPAGGTLFIETADVSVPAGDPPPHAEMDPHRDDVRLRVRDSGVGMDADTRRRVFEPFFTTKPPGEGTGLGLAIVFGIVERCGGQLVVTSEPGAGTTFDAYLPTWQASPETTSDLHAPHAPARAPSAS